MWLKVRTAGQISYFHHAIAKYGESDFDVKVINVRKFKALADAMQYKQGVMAVPRSIR